MAKKRKRTRGSKLNFKKIAKDLGAKHLIDPKEKDEFEKRHGLPHPLVPISERTFKIYWGGCKTQARSFHLP